MISSVMALWSSRLRRRSKATCGWLTHGRCLSFARPKESHQRKGRPGARAGCAGPLRSSPERALANSARAWGREKRRGPRMHYARRESGGAFLLVFFFGQPKEKIPAVGQPPTRSRSTIAAGDSTESCHGAGSWRICATLQMCYLLRITESGDAIALFLPTRVRDAPFANFQSAHPLRKVLSSP